jgi:hypothetical protein
VPPLAWITEGAYFLIASNRMLFSKMTKLSVGKDKYTEGAEASKEAPKSE